MAVVSTRSQRMETRLRPDQKVRIERAARLRGLSLSDFIVQHADQAAKEIIREEAAWKLAERDRKVFIAALLNPPAPNARLKAAAARYKKALSSS